jgi:23S rRNA pseudouridine2604 synthase
MRINKFFTENGICSRREADRLIQEGRVTLNQQVAKLGDQVVEGDLIYLDGKLIEVKKKTPIVIAYNKPVGVECTSDSRVPNNIIDAVRYPERLVHIGRLDVMSEGLILLTNMGDIVNPILRRKYHHEKEYLVQFNEQLSPRILKAFREGVDLGDAEGPTLPCRASRIGKNRASLVLTEGRNRQIRRMAEAVGLKVIKLKRVRIMHIELGDLKIDTWRALTKPELEKLMTTLDQQEKLLANQSTSHHELEELE